MQDGIGTQGTVTYSYDPLGRLISQTNEYNITTSYEYDLVNNMTSITYPNNSTAIRTFDGANELLSVQTWLTFGTNSCNITTDTSTFSYDYNGNLKSTTLPDCDTKNTPIS